MKMTNQLMEIQLFILLSDNKDLELYHYQSIDLKKKINLHAELYPSTLTVSSRFAFLVSI